MQRTVGLIGTRTKWQKEMGGVGKIDEVKEDIDNTKEQIERFERDCNLWMPSELKCDKLSELEEKLACLSKKGNRNKMLPDEVTSEDINEVLSSATGIPQQKLPDAEHDCIVHTAESLEEKVIGQDEAIEVMSDAMQRSRAGMNDPTKPLAILMFLGPTGRGQNATCESTGRLCV